jgi:putative metallohydrolase (TIGR04338 family)
MAFEGRTERGAAYKTPPEYRTLAECQEYVDTVTASETWAELCYPSKPVPVTVTDGRGRRRGGARSEDGQWWLAMPRSVRRRWYILHELAHVAVGEHEAAPHGPEYVGAYLHLVRPFLGDEAHADLVRAMAARRVKMRAYLGSGVFDVIERVSASEATAPPPEADVTAAETPAKLRRCDRCGRKLSAIHRGRFCSDECRTGWHNERRHERLAQAWVRVCVVCGTEFESHRNDARYCSGRCRQRAHRQRL